MNAVYVAYLSVGVCLYVCECVFLWYHIIAYDHSFFAFLCTKSTSGSRPLSGISHSIVDVEAFNTRMTTAQVYTDIAVFAICLP